MRAARGMTILELMIVLAIIASLAILARIGVRALTGADLVDSANELAAIMKRTSQLAVEHGEMHRIVFDLEKQGYIVEVCKGAAGIQRNEKIRPDEEAAKRGLDKGKDKLLGMPADANASTDPEAATKRALAIGGAHLADRMCGPATDTYTGDSKGKGWARQLPEKKGIRFREIWVQHRDEKVTKATKPQPQVAIYFYPDGSAEKAIVELTDGDPDRSADGDTFSVLVYGLTGHVDLLDGVPRDPNDHMMKNVMGDKEAQREGQP
jgi:prepilin-type N-terminal cleavage/methylation domain-containing protein